MSGSFWFRTGAIVGLISVAAGTFGAHVLEGFFRDLPVESSAGSSALLSPERRLEDFEIGVRYQMAHALALLALGLAASRRPKPARAEAVAGWSFLWGIVIFSGSLYAIGLTGQKWLGMITPIGGVMFFVGWVALAMVSWPDPERSEPGPATS